MSAPTALVFDLFGVIACAQSPTGRAEILAAAGAPACHAEEFWRAYWELRPSYDRGRLSGPDYWRSVAGAVDTTFTRTRIAELIAADCGSWRAVDPQMLDLLDVLARSGLTLGLLSNIPPERADDFLQRHAWLGRFDVLGFSCRIGHVKPEPAAFDWCIRTLGLEPARILFVDDREENVRAARDCGMQGHLFTDAATLARSINASEDDFAAPCETDSAQALLVALNRGRRGGRSRPGSGARVPSGAMWLNICSMTPMM
jgi:putative hydrolase of the HAD superfamily